MRVSKSNQSSGSSLRSLEILYYNNQTRSGSTQRPVMTERLLIIPTKPNVNVVEHSNPVVY